jgi:molybdopterin biosynthesis enzyme MoaB
MDEIQVGILTVSDTCSQGKSEDISGKNLSEFVLERFGRAGTYKTVFDGFTVYGLGSVFIDSVYLCPCSLAP